MAMDGIASFLERVKALREHESLHDLMMDPTARVLLGVVVGALLMVLVFLQPYPEEVEEQERKGAGPRSVRPHACAARACRARLARRRGALTLRPPCRPPAPASPQGARAARLQPERGGAAQD